MLTIFYYSLIVPKLGENGIKYPSFEPRITGIAGTADNTSKPKQEKGEASGYLHI